VGVTRFEKNRLRERKRKEKEKKRERERERVKRRTPVVYLQQHSCNHAYDD